MLYGWFIKRATKSTYKGHFMNNFSKVVNFTNLYPEKGLWWFFKSYKWKIKYSLGSRVKKSHKSFQTYSQKSLNMPLMQKWLRKSRVIHLWIWLKYCFLRIFNLVSLLLSDIENKKLTHMRFVRFFLVSRSSSLWLFGFFLIWIWTCVWRNRNGLWFFVLCLGRQFEKFKLSLGRFRRDRID